MGVIRLVNPARNKATDNDGTRTASVNETLRRLYEKHASALLLYARIWCRSPEDALQEALIDLASRSELPPDPVAWLYQAVRFKAINVNRGEQRRTRREQDVAFGKEPYFVSAPNQTIASGELEDALKALSEEQREIVIARIWGGLTFGQIAELNGQSSSSVHRRYHEALEILKRRLDGKPCEVSNE